MNRKLKETIQFLILGILKVQKTQKYHEKQTSTQNIVRSVNN